MRRAGGVAVYAGSGDVADGVEVGVRVVMALGWERPRGEAVEGHGQRRLTSVVVQQVRVEQGGRGMERRRLGGEGEGRCYLCTQLGQPGVADGGDSRGPCILPTRRASSGGAE